MEKSSIGGGEKMLLQNRVGRSIDLGGGQAGLVLRDGHGNY